MKANEKESVMKLLRELTRQIQSLDDDQISRVLAGVAKLELRVVNRKSTSNAKTRHRLKDEELRELSDQLKSLRTREEGNNILNEMISSKEDVTRLARQLDTPVQKTDSVEQIRARIIEATIGFRIRSAAIQGVAPKLWDKQAASKGRRTPYEDE